MQGLIPEFTQADIDRRIDAFRKDKVSRSFEALSWLGIRAVNYAKKKHLGNWTDQSGCLRSSVGYAVIFDGDVRIEKFDQVLQGAEGVVAGQKLVQELAAKYNKGMVLVVTAGMEYAAAVESKGYDVITGSSYEAEKLRSYLVKKLGANLS